MWAQHGYTGPVRDSKLVEEWFLGKVYLANGDSVNGKIIYYRTEEIVRVINANDVAAEYTPKAVSGFEAVDKDGKFRRVFITHRWNFGQDYSDLLAPSFFEQITIGKYGLLRKEAIVRKDMLDNPFYSALLGGSPIEPGIPRGVVYTDKRQDVFFILMPTGKVKQLRDVKKDLKVVFGKKNRQMRPYIMKNRLKLTRLPDLVKIITYFDSIS
ncbi:hypothetical protein GCM10023183_18260 [Nibribacter koreensis]|uniref:Uncharacterized protein n=1 Tax=Nibribacter koreensis TaxID=1084519 RepID=A0ABP8FJ36_9BACT